MQHINTKEALVKEAFIRVRNGVVTLNHLVLPYKRMVTDQVSYNKIVEEAKGFVTEEDLFTTKYLVQYGDTYQPHFFDSLEEAREYIKSRKLHNIGYEHLGSPVWCLK